VARGAIVPLADHAEALSVLPFESVTGSRSPGGSTRNFWPHSGQRTFALIGIGLLDVKTRLHQMHRTWFMCSAICETLPRIVPSILWEQRC
jgi:hypothetical protein